MDQIIMIRDAFFVEQNSVSLFPKGQLIILLHFNGEKKYI